MGLILFLLVLTVFGFSFFSNKDVFGPTKLYFTYLIVFYVDIFVSPQLRAVYAVYLGLILLGALISFFESRRLPKKFFRSQPVWVWSDRLVSRGLKIVWLLSLLPLGVLLGVIFFKGGLPAFINSIGNRVLEWRGLGPILIFVGWFPLLNLIYFSILIQNRLSRWHWCGFFIHFGLLMAIGMMMGSRGFLNSFLVMLLAYNYLRKPISLGTAATVGGLLLMAALLLGTLRSGMKWDDSGLQTGFETQHYLLETGSLSGALVPLQLVYSREPFELQYGLTFLTAFTNMVPRELWPGKPSTGGVVLTEDYMSYAWGGASNLSTGIISEGVLNFGPWIGTFFGFILFGFFLLALLKFYERTREDRDFFDIMLYSSFLLCVIGLLGGEFTNMMVPTLMTKLIPLFLFRFILGRDQSLQPAEWDTAIAGSLRSPHNCAESSRHLK